MFPVGDLLLRVGDLLVKGVFAVPVLRPAVVQFFPGIAQLRLGIGQLLGHLCLGVGELLLGLVDLLLGLVPDGVSPQLGPLFGERFQLVGALLYQLLIGVAVSHQLGSALKQEVGVSIGLHIKGFHGQQNKIAHFSGAQRGGASLHTDVQRRVGTSNYGKFRLL